MNKVIIVGGVHHNALGIARVFGINGVRPYGILISSSKNSNYVTSSKYWEKTYLVKDYSDAINCLIQEFGNEKEKPVVMPTSDGAGYAIDLVYNKLKGSFLLPHINHTQGLIAYLMDKMNQYKWANSMGFRMAKTWEYNFSAEKFNFSEIVYPCIIKPVISAEGEKLDIKKCQSEEELKRIIFSLKSKGYKRTLIQEYLKKDFEAELIGCIPERSTRIPYVFTKNVREWPPVGGTGSYHEFIMDKKLKHDAESILKSIKEYGYVGNIDVELFVIKGELILNEVNFRNSGDVYYCLYNQVFYPLFLYLDVTGQDTSSLNIEYGHESWPMNELTDLRYVVYGRLSLLEWMKDNHRCHDYAVWLRSDLKPVFKRYWECLTLMFRKRKEQKEKLSEV